MADAVKIIGIPKLVKKTVFQCFLHLKFIICGRIEILVWMIVPWFIALHLLIFFGNRF